MASFNVKAAQLGQAGGLRNCVLLGGEHTEDTKTPTELQVRLLTRRFAVSLPVAILLASLAYGEARQ